MHRATRKQVDNHDAMSEATQTPGGGEQITRQEFKDEADLNILLKRFGVGQAFRPIQNGEVDYTMDFQQALMAIADARRAWRTLPDELKKRYPSWRDVLNAAEKGDLDLSLPEAPPSPPTPETAPA